MISRIVLAACIFITILGAVFFVGLGIVVAIMAHHESVRVPDVSISMLDPAGVAALTYRGHTYRRTSVSLNKPQLISRHAWPLKNVGFVRPFGHQTRVLRASTANDPGTLYLLTGGRYVGYSR
ncbi:MAG TPA: hypothetical protein VF898_09105 [Chloroflexota bacterium]